MKKTIILILLAVLLVTSVSAEMEHYYEIDLVYDMGVVSYDNLTVIPSQDKLERAEGLHIAEVVSFDNEILNLTYFSMSRELIVDYLDPKTGKIGGGEIIMLNHTEVKLYVPYYENAQEINIYDWNLTKLLSIDVSSYAKDRKVIQEVETVSQKGVGDIVDQEEPKKGLSLLWIGLIIFIALILVLALLLFTLLRKNRNQ